MKIELYNQAFLDLWRKNRRSPEVYAPFGFWHPLRRLRRYTVARAFIGIWSPWAALAISRVNSYLRGFKKIKCDACGEAWRSRDLDIGGEDDLDLLCSNCAEVDAWWDRLAHLRTQARGPS